ncbi:hypothetical protein FACS1894172_06690 [Spirochaetia bacterium]|nr:hypothetical protein FACS1894172_06690 [Spirochaetia bacterium]
MKKTSVFMAATLFTLLVMVAVSCDKGGGISSLDVVGKDSINSFDKLLQQTARQVSPDEMNGGWSLAAPDNTARFIWSKNYAESPLHDVMLELDAAPFLAAGLDPDKLSENFAFYEGMIMVGTKLGEETLKYSGEVTPLASYEQIVKLKRNSIGYHGALDHYGVNLGDGNLFEWAKDMSTNDKDMVFVLNPEPFIAAGVDPDRIEGWAFAKVTVDDANGKPVEVDKILKPINLL